MIIGDRENKIKELLTFEREKNKNESPESFLNNFLQWAKLILKNINIIAFVSEEAVSTDYHRSDTRTKQSRGAIGQLYVTAICKNSEGQSYSLHKEVSWFEVNNKSWKKEIVPKHFKDMYRTEREAYHKFVGSVIRPVARMKDDIAAAFCMYIYALAFQYGKQKLRAVKSAIDYNHNMMMICIPFSGIRKNAKEITVLSENLVSGKLNSRQQEFIAGFKAGYTKAFSRMVLGEEYNDEYINNYNGQIRDRALSYLNNQSDEKSIKQEMTYLSSKIDKYGLVEIDFSDEYSPEENARAFTKRDHRVYFCVIEKNLHYCYTIPMFDLLLTAEEKIIMICTGY